MAQTPCICLLHAVTGQIDELELNWVDVTGCLSQLDYYSNYKTHRAFKNCLFFNFFHIEKVVLYVYYVFIMKKFEKRHFKMPCAFCILSSSSNWLSLFRSHSFSY